MTLPFPKEDIFKKLSDKSFEDMALQLFEFHYVKNKVYHDYCYQIGINPKDVKSEKDIPYLPISFFKTHEVYLSHLGNPQKTFSSSGTTSQKRSQHKVYDLDLYKTSFEKSFFKRYGNPTNYAILALLPSYEREKSSLIYMVDSLVHLSKRSESIYYTNFKALQDDILSLKNQNVPTLLIGVSYALLDFVKEFPTTAKDLIVIETGGMKGRKEELSRVELHNILCRGFGVKSIHSEYGMTELLSQAYAIGGEFFAPPPWMKVSPRDPYDPMTKGKYNHTVAINIIDLANLYSCAFIATEDLGIITPNGKFSVLGRLQNSDIRGCNLLYTSL